MPQQRVRTEMYTLYCYQEDIDALEKVMMRCKCSKAEAFRIAIKKMARASEPEEEFSLDEIA